jgi:hypothetical protein
VLQPVNASAERTTKSVLNAEKLSFSGAAIESAKRYTVENGVVKVRTPNGEKTAPLVGRSNLDSRSSLARAAAGGKS